MTEAEWLTQRDILGHLAFVVARLSPRRERLLAAALCRTRFQFYNRGTVWTPSMMESAAESIELYADGMTASCDSIRGWARYAGLVTHSFDQGDPLIDDLPTYPEAEALCRAVEAAATTPLVLTDVGKHIYEVTRDDSDLVPLVWDVGGNPFRSVTFLPEWRTSTVLALAKAMYDSRDFSAMPILADALADAGCEDESILTHCRGSELHVRGCWCVDKCLGKS